MESLKRKVGSSSQVEEWAKDDDDNDDSRNDSRNDSDSHGKHNSTKLKSAQRCKWAASDEEFLGRLKLAQSNHNGLPSDQVIAERLKRSVEAVKQHWTTMQKTGRQNGKGHDKKARRRRRRKVLPSILVHRLMLLCGDWNETPRWEGDAVHSITTANMRCFFGQPPPCPFHV